MHLNLQQQPEASAETRKLPTFSVAAATNSPARATSSLIGVAAPGQANRFPLPAWAHGVRDQVERIVANPPERSFPLDQMMCGRVVNYGFRGRDAALVRKAFSRAREIAYATAQARYYGGVDWDEASREFNALLNGEQPDAMLVRLVEEAR